MPLLSLYSPHCMISLPSPYVAPGPGTSARVAGAEEMPGPDPSCSAATTAAGLAKLAFCILLLQWLPRPENHVPFLPSMSALFLQFLLVSGAAPPGSELLSSCGRCCGMQRTVSSSVPGRPVNVLAMYLQATPRRG